MSQRMPGAEERVCLCRSILAPTPLQMLIQTLLVPHQINHVFQITTSHLSILLAARTALVADLAHKRAYAPAEIAPSAGLMLKTLTKHVGALIKHLRVRPPIDPLSSSFSELTRRAVL